jgi:replicative DNA helicase
MNEPKRIKKSIANQSILEYGKLSPQAIDLEEAVLGALILERDALPKIIHIVRAEIFYKEAHQKIFQAINDLYEKNHPIDLLTVTEQLKKNGDLETVGGPFYVTQLTSRIASSTNIQYHCMIVFQKYLQREIIRICSNTIQSSFNETEDLFDIHDKLIDDIKKLGIDKANVKENIEESVESTFEIMDNDAKKETKTFYKTRLNGINEMLSITQGNILLLGSMSGAGKTSITADIAMGLCENNPDDISILWYSMEDPPKNLILGYISREIKLTIKQMLGIGYKMSKEEIEQAKTYQKQLKSFDIEFVGKRNKIRTIKNHFINFVEKRKEEHKDKKRLYVLIVDNLMKLLDYNEEKNLGYNTAVDDYVAATIGDIFDATKDCCYIIIVHHFTKEQFNKKNLVDAYKPNMEHFRGSSRLHEICTQVVLLNRPGMFSDLLKEYQDTPYYETLQHLFLIDVTKNRFLGNTGMIRLLCDLHYRKFEDLNIEIQ